MSQMYMTFDKDNRCIYSGTDITKAHEVLDGLTHGGYIVRRQESVINGKKRINNRIIYRKRGRPDFSLPNVKGFVKSNVIYVFVVLLVMAVMALIVGGTVSSYGSNAQTTEFTTNQAGSPRFQRNDTNDSAIKVVVDTSTGVEYMFLDGNLVMLRNQYGGALTVGEVG